MFETLIQQLTDKHNRIITEFQEKINSDESYYVLVAKLVSPTNIHFYIETEYDTGQIDGLCLKVMTVYIDRYETHTEDEVKTLVETELENAKEKLKQFVPQVSKNTRLVTENQLEQIESSQPTDLYYNALKEPAKISQEAKIFSTNRFFSPNCFSTYFKEN